MTTYKGFLKNGVYNEISCLILKYSENDRDSLISKVVDICYSKGEFNNLVSFLVNCFVRTNLTQDLQFVKLFNKYITNLQKLPRKNVVNTKLFQERILDILSLITLKERKKRDKFEKILKNIDTIKSTLITYSFECDTCDRDINEFDGELPIELFQQFAALKFLIKNREKKLAVGLVYIMYNKKISSYSIGNVDLSCFTGLYSPITNDKENKDKDIVPFIWKFIYNISNRSELIEKYFQLYHIGLTKKNKPERINLILYTVLILSISDEIIITSDYETRYEDKYEKERYENIDVYFYRNLESKVGKVGKKIDALSSSNISSAMKESSSDSKNIDSGDSKNIEDDHSYDYLKCITYVDNEVINTVFDEKICCKQNNKKNIKKVSVSE